jgi:hypothetical protein
LVVRLTPLTSTWLSQANSKTESEQHSIQRRLDEEQELFLFQLPHSFEDIEMEEARVLEMAMAEGDTVILFSYVTVFLTLFW